MVRIFANPGHGGSDPGAIGNGLREKDLVLTISKKIEEILKRDYQDFTLRLFRPGDQFYSLSEIVRVANSWDADIFVSIHINAGGGTGFESYIFNGSVSSETVNNQNIIHDEIMSNISGVRDRGKKRANFAVLRGTSMPAILTENLFIDTKADADKLKDDNFLNSIAKGHADGIAKAVGLKKKTSSNNTQNNNTSSNNSTNSNQNNKGNKSAFEWVGTGLKGRRVESVYRGSEGLNFYNGPRWTNPTGQFMYGEGWIIDNLYRVNGSLMYRVQNSRKQLFWITANKKYVKVV